MSAPVGHHEERRDCRIWVQIWFSTSTRFTRGILPVRSPLSVAPAALGPVADCRVLVVAPRPGFQPGRSSRPDRPSIWLAALTGASRRGPARGLPTDGDESRRASSRPRSQAEPAVRAPRRRDAVAQVAVVGHDEQVAVPVGPIEQPDVVDEARMTASPVRGPL